jgi:hypothetical protein
MGGARCGSLTSRRGHKGVAALERNEVGELDSRGAPGAATETNSITGSTVGGNAQPERSCSDATDPSQG